MGNVKKPLRNDNSASSGEIVSLLQDLKLQIHNQNKRLDRLESKLAINQDFDAKPAKLEKQMPVDDFSTPKKELLSQTKNQTSVEENIAGNWFAKIGILALSIGIAFFLKYAFDNDWINELGRIIIGIFIGAVLYGVGLWLMKKYFVYGQVLTGGGLGIVYLSLFAAHNFYGLLSYPIAFLLISLVTALAVFTSLFKNAPSLSYVSALVAYLTPFLLWSSQINHVGLFFYLIIVNLAIVTLSFLRREDIWKGLPWMAFVATELIFLVWQGQYWSTHLFFTVMPFLIIYFLLFSLSPIIKFIKDQVSSLDMIQFSTVVAVTFFLHAYYLMDKVDSPMGYLPFFLALYYGALSLISYFVNSQEKSYYSFFSALAMLFAIIFVPIYFKNDVITYFWLLEFLLVSFLASKFKNLSYMVMAFVLGFLITIDLFVANNSMTNRTQEFLLMIFGAIVFYFAGYLFNVAYKESTSENDISFFKVMKYSAVTLANIFTLHAVNREIRNYYYMANYDLEAISLSIWWLLYGTILIVVGFIGKYKKLRLGALILLCLAILKLFFNDLWSLGQLYRIISSIILGIVLLLISFGYQKYKHLIKDLI